jgi:hypothetical protein
MFRSECYDDANDFLISGIEHPTEATKAGYEGTEDIQFMVNQNGNVTDFKVINSVSELIDTLLDKSFFY